jgi:pimeloyl-ACP methyl ester carboxylesterase
MESPGNIHVESFSAQIDGCALQAQRITPPQVGDCPAIVFLHDSFGSIRLWRRFPERIALQMRCQAFVYERQGHGHSPPFARQRTISYMDEEAELLLKLLDRWCLDRCILFGHSDGGTIALMAAALQPKRFAALVTEGAHVFVEEETLGGIATTVCQYATTDLKGRLEKYHGDKTDALFHAWSDTWQAPWYRDWNIEDRLSRIQCPVLVIQGENDEYGTYRQVEAIVNQVSGAACKAIIPNAGHTPHKEAPAATLNVAVDFLQSVCGP